jgi:V-type H+-transporting ATPase subunit a
MTFSLCLSYVNARHFKTPIDIWGNFLPGMIFFQSIFGYLVFAIVYKWTTDWYAVGRDPPGLLNMLIYMFLSPGTIEAPLYSGQATVQKLLLAMAGICVPILLFLKPFYLRHQYNKTQALGYRGIGDSTRVSALDDDDDDSAEAQTLNGGRESIGDDDEGAAVITEDIGHGEHEEFEFSEVMIHQVIHTIGKLRTARQANCEPSEMLTFGQNSASTAYHTQPPIFDSGHCPWPINNYRKFLPDVR